MKINIILVLFSLLILASCVKESSDSVNQDKIWVEYQLIYDENTQLTSAKAIFKFSNILGTLLELTSPAYVTFNNDTLNFNPLGYYEKSYTTFVNSGTFVYEDLDGNVFTNSVSISDTIDFPSGLNSINKTVPFELVWQGAPVKANETITAWLDSNIEGDSRIEFTNSIGATSLIFPANKLANLGLGPHGKLYMERLYSVEVTNDPNAVTSAGGLINCKYIPKNLTGINIVE